MRLTAARTTPKIGLKWPAICTRWLGPPHYEPGRCYPGNALGQAATRDGFVSGFPLGSLGAPAILSGWAMC